MKKKDKVLITILGILPILFAGIVSTYAIFGSKLDWLSQHISIADYFRQNFYATHQILPDQFKNLQAHTNVFAFSYYGILRPDVLISYLFPSLPVKYFVIGYAVLLWSMSGILCYWWLQNKGYKKEICFFSSICCICANCFFQAHQQIMFTEIIPFLFLSLIFIDQNKKQWIAFCIFFALLHNYFYSPGMILMILLYNYFVDHKIKDVLLPIVFGIGIASVLWLPTGLYILENHKSVAQTNFFDLFIPNLKLKGLLYNEYGCGLTVISWLALFQGIQFKKTRKLSILLIGMFLFPIFSYILNGTLYARTKILVLCLPLVLLILSYWLNERKLDKRWLLMSSLFLLNKSMLLGLCVSLLFIGYYFIDRKECLLMYALVPIIVFTGLNYNQCLNPKLYHQVYAKEKEILLKKNELKQNTADLDHIRYSVNHIYDIDETKASSYTSTSNSLYNTFFYDILKNPISQSNRTILADSSNYLYLNMMGIQNVITKQDNLYGYTKVDEQGKYKLLKNKNVFPLMYVSNDTYSESKFDKLKYPYNLDTLYTHTIVKEKTKSSYQSRMKLVKNIDQKISIYNKTKVKKRIKNNLDTKNKMVCIDFNVKNHTNNKVSIVVNGMQNVLSKKHSVYPNKNTHFTYVLTQKDLKNFEVTMSKGKYDISNIRIYTCDMDIFHREYTKVKYKEIQNGYQARVRLKKDGYFVTSFPYEKGYEIYMDGKKHDIEIVNKAFVGCKISKGKHDIEIQYHSPGKKLGTWFSFVSICLGGLWIWKKSKN